MKSIRRAVLLAAVILWWGVVGQAAESNVITGFAVEGNRLIPSSTILLNLQLKPGDKLDEESIKSEVARIGEMGFFSWAGAEVRPKGQGKEVVFKVTENAIITEVHLKGNTRVATSTLLAEMESKTGTVFNSKMLSQDINALNEAMGRAGFLFSKVSDAYVKEQGSQIFIEITEAILADIKIEGLKKTKERVVTRELTVKKGEIYNNNKVVRDMQRIYNLGFFEEVTRDHLPGATPSEVVLQIKVKEQKTGRAGVGGGYSSLNGLVGFVNLSQNNFNGEGKRVYVKTEFGGVKTYEVGYFDPWVGNRPVSFGVDVYDTKYNRSLYAAGSTLSDYDEHRKGGNIGVGRRLAPGLDLSLHFRDEDIRITPTTDGAVLPQGILNGRVQSIGAILDKDTRDNRFRATRGRRDSISVETTGGFLRGENQYTKYVGALRRYFPFGRERNTVVAVQAVGGQATTGEGFVPIYDLFAVGGSNTVRGYREREFLGTKMAYLNLELRRNITKNFDIVGFFDTGDAWGVDTLNQRSSTFDAKRGFGLGLRLQTPLGPVAIDYGKATDRDDGRTYFNFGGSF